YKPQEWSWVHVVGGLVDVKKDSSDMKKAVLALATAATIVIETRVQASQSELVAKAKQAATDELKAQVSQKDTQIESLGRTVEELKRKLEQGSQQTQGEAFELELESLLRGKFPLDLIEPVAKGE